MSNETTTKGIRNRPFFAGVLEGDRAMQQMFERHLRCFPNLQEEYSIEKFLCRCFLTHDEEFVPYELRFFNRDVGQFEIGDSSGGIDLERHKIFHRRIIEMFGHRTGAWHQ